MCSKKQNQFPPSSPTKNGIMNLPVKSIQIEIRIKFATPKTGLIHIFIYHHVLSYTIIYHQFIIFYHISSSYIYIYSKDILSFHTKHAHFVVYLHVHHFHPFSLSPPCAIKILLGHSHKRTLHLPEYW